MASKKTEAKKARVSVHSLALARDTEETLERLSGEASDFIGRKVSGSAVVRALLRHVERENSSWVTAQIFSLVEAELSSGVTWGKKK
jgi:hypothetical protein